MKASRIRALGVVCLTTVLAVACGGGGESGADSEEAAFAPVREQYAALQSKRQELADLRDQIAAAAEEGMEEAQEGAAEAEETAMVTLDELEAEADQVKGEIDAMSEEFMGSLIGFLNSRNLVEGEEPSALTKEAIHLKSGEDLLIAREYVSRGGDYRRAIEILSTALVLDPDNPELLATKEQYEAEQFMTEERLAEVKKGMTEAEVRATLGTPHPSNVREYPEQNVVAWFYRREDKGAAGVYFQSKDDVLTVYKTDFNAVKPNEEAE